MEKVFLISDLGHNILDKLCIQDAKKIILVNSQMYSKYKDYLTNIKETYLYLYLNPNLYTHLIDKYDVFCETKELKFAKKYIVKQMKEGKLDFKYIANCILDWRCNDEIGTKAHNYALMKFFISFTLLELSKIKKEYEKILLPP